MSELTRLRAFPFNLMITFRSEDVIKTWTRLIPFVSHSPITSVFTLTRFFSISDDRFIAGNQYVTNIKNEKINPPEIFTL